MAKPKGRRLKVFSAEIDGLHEWLVAAPSRPAALDAFGVSQDLFAQGMAAEETDPAKVQAALAAPGTLLRRMKGSGGAFAAASGPSDWSAAVPKGARAVASKPRDRKALDAAEARLKALEDHHRRVLGDIEADRVRLAVREAAEAKVYQADRRQAEAIRDRAAKAYGR